MSKTAEELFKEGYNCAQAVFCANCEEYGIDIETGAKLASAFGGGMGRMREVCGALSGLFMLLGLKEGYSDPKDIEGKKELYSKVQSLAAQFKEEFGSIICKELLGLEPKCNCNDPNPTKRDEKFYQKRPCVENVKFASELFNKIEN